MTKQWWVEVENDPVHAEAAEWFARLQEPELTFEEMVEWQKWLDQDERHPFAFKRIETAWQALQDVSPQRVYEMALQHSRQVRSRAVGLAAAASILACVTLCVLWNTVVMPASTQRVATAIGENRTVRLVDGSQVTLGGHSEVAIVFGAEERRVDLIRGEAYFAVARETARPFRVYAGNANVVALGTEFNVRRRADRVVVGVVEGKVRVEPRPRLALESLLWLQNFSPKLRQVAPELQPIQLTAGLQATADGGGVEGTAALNDPASIAAWRQGVMSFQRQPLRYALEDVNRYSPKPIVIEDPSIGDLHITGTVVSNNVGEWIASLENAFGLHATEEPRRIVLRRGQ